MPDDVPTLRLVFRIGRARLKFGGKSAFCFITQTTGGSHDIFDGVHVGAPSFDLGDNVRIHHLLADPVSPVPYRLPNGTVAAYFLALLAPFAFGRFPFAPALAP
jgi:hypothetical protein